MATEKSKQIAREILPFLVHLAQTRRVTTYLELAQHTGRHQRNFNYPLGYIRDLCIERGLPLLPALVVNQDTHVPGDSFLPEGRGNLSDDAYRQKWEEHRDSVFQCQEWEAFLREFELQPRRKNAADLEIEGRTHLQVQARRPPNLEEETARQALKRFAAENPFTLPVPSYKPPEWNHRFPSGDTCDLVYDLEGLGIAIVQVCYGKRGELVAAIHHLQKCREQMMAVKRYTEIGSVKARLVAFDVPEDIRDFAMAHDIRCTTISRSRVMEGV